jgi:hypothetical protein
MKKAIILASIVLSGCAADGKLGKEGSPVWHNRATIAEKVQYFTPNCIEYGFKEGSAEFKQCVVDEIRASKADASAKMASINAYNAANKSVTCRTYGNTTRCN